MDTVRSISQPRRWSCGSLPALVGVIVFILFVGSIEATAAGDDVLPEALGSISGVVTNAASQPISGINITLYGREVEGWWPPIRSVKSDDSGAYLLPALRPGIYRLQFRDPQRAYAQEFYQRAPTLEAATEIPIAGNHVSDINVSLAPAAQISGFVSIEEMISVDRGHVGIYIQVGTSYQSITATAILTPTGAYQVGELLPGTYRICGSAVIGDDSYQGTFTGCYGGASLDSARDIQLAAGETLPDINLRLAEGQFEGQITGTVTADGAPLAGIVVSLYAFDPVDWAYYLPQVYTYTNAAGAYQLGGLQDGNYWVGFSDPAGDYVTRYYRDQSRPEQATILRIREGGTIGNVNASLPRAGAISGQIRFVDNTYRFSSTRMVLYQVTDRPWVQQTRDVVPDPAGNYTLKGLEPGTYRVCVPFLLLWQQPFPFTSSHHPNCYGTDRFAHTEFESAIEQAADILVEAGVTTSGIDFVVGPETWHMPVIQNHLSAEQLESKITGKVTSEGVPLKGIQVSLYLPFNPQYPELPFVPLRYTYTDATGEYQIDGLKEGRYQIGFSDPAGNYVSRYYPNGSWPDTGETIILRGGATISNINADLPRAGGISGRIHFIEGRPATPILALLYRLTGEHWEMHGRQVEVEPGGNYAIRAILPGTYRVCLPFDLPPDPYRLSHFPNCYGTGHLSKLEVEDATDISVKAGVTTGGIDFVVGPELWYAPGIRTQ